MTRERLDQILLRKGLVSEEQIKQALMRQKTHGGYLGSHLLYFKHLSERQILEALEEQLGVPGVELSGRDVSEDVIRKVPVKLVSDQHVFPFQYDSESRTLHLAVLEPDNQIAPLLVQEAAMANDVKVYVAIESALHNAIQVHYHGKSWSDPSFHIVELPELFGEEGRPEEEPLPPHTSDSQGRADPQEILLVSQAAFLKSFLVPLFEREGLRLCVLGQPAEIAAYLEGTTPDQILVQQEMEEVFDEWVREDVIPGPQVQVTTFASVPSSLLGNPVPYRKMAGSLLQVLQEAAEFRCMMNDWRPPYSLIRKDIRELARSMGLHRIAEDGLQIAALLLVPERNAASSDDAKRINLGIEFFQDVTGTLARAKNIAFPWNVDACLRAFFSMMSGEPPASSAGKHPERFLGAQILVMIWYRYAAFAGVNVSSETILEAVRSRLEKLEGNPFAPELVKTYLRLLNGQKKKPRLADQRDVFIIGEPSEASRQLSIHLRQEGYRIVEVKDFSEALHLYERKRPDVILLEYDEHPDQARDFSRMLKKDSDLFLYALTAKSHPSVVLGLLDEGFHDVFAPPYNVEIIAARIHKSLTNPAREGAKEAGPKGLSGTLKDLPFVDLIQTLAMNQRSVHLKLTHTGGQCASVYLRGGQITHASCGDVSGDEAVYRVIQWREDGTFLLEPPGEYPSDNIFSPNDYLLMEGCRLLDECEA